MQSVEYTRMFEVEDTHWWFAGKRRFAQVMLDRLPPVASRKILDVGCGTGGMHPLLRAYGSVVCGVDPSALALRCAAKRHIARLRRAALPELPFADGTFDLVTVFDVLYHRAVVNDQASLEELARVLRPGGHLLLTDSALQFLRSAHDASVHGARRYNLRQMRGKLRNAGFIIQRSSYANFFVFPALACWRLARRVFGSAQGSDVGDAPAWLNRFMASIYLLEAALLARVNLPIGSSIIALAQKTQTATSENGENPCN